MATETWIRFVHAWHTLGVVLKWMCITVVGIPVAIATCLVVALAALIFFALVLLTAAAILFGLYWLIRGSIMLLMRAPESFTEWLRVRADKRLLPLSEREKIPVHDPWNIGRISRRAARERHPPVQPVPAGYDDIEGQLQVPQAVHLAEERLPDSQIPASNIPGSNADLWRCEVCFEDKNRTEFPARVVTNTCQHGTLHCCNECLAQTITTAFEGNIWNDIRCPVCNEQLEHKDIAEFAPREIFERYDALSLRQTLERDMPNFRWCMGPDCSFGQEHPDDPSEQPISTCSACSFVSCARHNVPWHTNETCDQYEKRVVKGIAGANKKSEKIIQKISKQCPGCKRSINKNGGCNHMSCVCGRQFCWNCLHPYPGHTWGCSRRGVH